VDSSGLLTAALFVEVRDMKKNHSVDAIELLKENHKMVKKPFKSFEAASRGEPDEKKSIVEQITNALEVHATIEEEIFYPAVKKARSEQTQNEVLEAYEEHQQIKALLGALEGLSPDDETYDMKVKVLKEDVEHHVKEEEGKMFPDARKFLRKERLNTLGEKMSERKEELKSASSGPLNDHCDLKRQAAH
jgi:hemerythrin-like domain-containing protein